MKQPLTHRTGSLPELAGVLAAAVLCGIALLAHAQATTPDTRESAPPSSTPPVAPPTAVGGNGKPLVAPVRSKVLADPDTRMYSFCTTGDEHEAPGPGESQYKRPPKAEIVTEEEAKARGYRAGAHKVSCK